MRRPVCPWDSSEHPGFHLLALGSACSLDGNISFGLVFLYFSMLVCRSILSLCWRVLTACFSTLHYCPLMALALLAGSSLDSGGDTSVHVNSHWSVTNICIAQAEA
jgi:hypothetical protein